MEEYSAATCSDGAPSAQLSVMPTPHKFWRNNKTMEPSQLSRFGLTCAVLTANHGEALLTWFLAGFRVSPIPRQLREKTLQMISGRKCGGSWQMSLPGTYLPRTSKDARSIERPTNWKRWVTKSDALSFPRQTWVLTTFGSGTGYLHTPTCTANYASPSMQKWPSCRAFTLAFGKPSPANHEWLMGWPIGWSALVPLETVKFQSWQQQHSPTYHKAGSDAA